jgi:putative FMN-dependent luciferase-like monooxygenase
MQIGIFSITDLGRDPIGGTVPSEHERLRALTRMAVDAEAAGFDVFAIGEQHGPGYVSSAQTTILAYVAALTRRVTLSTSTTLITTNDPVRLAESFATLQHLSDGRVDLMLGRGNRGSVYPSFGQDPVDAAALTVENYALLHRLWRERDIDWSGRFRTALRGFTSVPRPLEDSPPPVWHALTHSPEIAELAARYGDGLFVNNLFMDIDFFTPYVSLYRDLYAAAGHGRREAAPLGAGGGLFVRERSQDARREYRPYFEATPLARAGSYEAALEQTGMTVGSPAEVVEKIGEFRERFGNYQRQLFIVDMGGLPEGEVRKTIDLAGGEVLPALRREVAVKPATDAGHAPER